MKPENFMKREECAADKGDQEHDAFQKAWAEYAKGGHGSLGWEKIAFTAGFGAGMKVAIESTKEDGE